MPAYSYIFITGLVIIILKLAIDHKRKSPLGLFFQIQLIVAVLSGFVSGASSLAILLFFTPILAYPVWSSWIKPDHKILWRTTAVLFLILSYILPPYLIRRFGHYLEPSFIILVAPLFFGTLVMLPLYVLNLLDWKSRTQQAGHKKKK